MAGPSRDDDRWQAVIGRDQTMDGSFVFAVISTGIYCRPSCPARRPKRENALFFNTCDAAELHGFRACKRCRPKEMGLDQRHAEIVATARQRIDAGEGPVFLRDLAQHAGMSPCHFQRVFKRFVGVSPKQYAIAIRNRKIRTAIQENRRITDAIYDAGFSSTGNFYEKSHIILGMKPVEYRNGARGMLLSVAIVEATYGYVLAVGDSRGIFDVSIADSPEILLRDFKRKYPHAKVAKPDKEFQKLLGTLRGVLAASKVRKAHHALPADIQGAVIQMKIWKAMKRPDAQR